MGKAEENSYRQHRIVQRKLARLMWTVPAADVRLQKSVSPGMYMPTPGTWTFDRAVDSTMPVPAGVMLGAHVGNGGKFKPIAPADAVFGEAVGLARKLSDEMALKLWNVWWTQVNLLPLSRDQVLAIRLAKLLAGPATLPDWEEGSWIPNL